MGTPEDVAAEKYFTPPCEEITCPFCGQVGFDKIGLKYHLKYYCNDYQDTKDLLIERVR